MRLFSKYLGILSLDILTRSVTTKNKNIRQDYPLDEFYSNWYSRTKIFLSQINLRVTPERLT